MAALHAVRSALRDAVRAGLAPVERLALRLGDPLPYAPIFIVSPPRSGSTLLYLLAVQKYRLSYRSEEHTSELQSLMRISYAVFCLKKKIYTPTKYQKTAHQ